MKLWSIIVLSLLLIPAAHAMTLNDSDVEMLVNIKTFAFGGVGYGGDISAGEKAYKQILARSSALEDFEKLYEVGNIQAKCYALVGIHILNPKRFNELASSIRSDKTEVNTMQGCLVGHEPINSIVKNIEEGGYYPINKIK